MDKAESASRTVIINGDKSSPWLDYNRNRQKETQFVTKFEVNVLVNDTQQFARE